MQLAPIPAQEAQRLASLYKYDVLDTPPEIAYDRVSQIASQLCQAPIAMVSLIDEHRQWVKACYGLIIDTIPRGISLCAHTIAQAEALIVEDTRQDTRFFDNPAVMGQPHIAFYAGIPLLSTEGLAIGSLCVIDQQPRRLSPSQRTALLALADQVMLLLELRRTNRQLQRTSRQAETLAGQKAQLLATLSHEIRNPLHALEGFSQELLEEAPRPDQLEGLHRLQATGRTLLGLVNNILDYSKLQAGKLALEAIPFSLAELMQQALELQAWQVRQKPVRLVCQLDPGLPPVLLGDVTRLLQVLLNLLSNALKFTQQGEVRLEARLLSVTDTTVDLVLSVTDTGIGIEPAAVATLFDEYTQVSASTTRLYGGSGLGLAITRQLIELMGGRLSVESEPGVGSCFSAQLTLRRTEPLQPLTTHADSSIQAPILAVDDYPVNTKWLTNLLTRQGCQVMAYNCPQEALTAAQNTPFRAMLLDLHLPGMSGFDLAGQLRLLQPAVPLIAMSADDSNELQEQVQQAGFVGFLRKPFLAQQLLHLLNSRTR